MTMRKYLVTIHEDGSLTAIEYEEPNGYTASQTVKQSAAREIVEMLKARKRKYLERARECASGEDWDGMHVNMHGYTEDYLVLRWIERRFHLS